jgi:hypothetical protein
MTRYEPRELRLLTAALLLAALAVSTSCADPAIGHPESTTTSADGVRSPTPSESRRGAGQGEKMSETWNEIDRLVEDRKYREALERARIVLDSVRNTAGQGEWVRALIRVAELETGLHGYETAVRTLREEPWPDSPIGRTVVELYYAQGLTTFRQAYSWEIGQRERSVSDDELDLDAWTDEQLAREAERAFLEVWQRRESLGAEPLGTLAPYLEPNNYPRSVRGTVRDAVAYLWANLLGDSSLWTPAEHDDVYLLDVADLIAGHAAKDGSAEPMLTGRHPLEKIGSILADLERWHEDGGRAEAALEARLERIRQLRPHFSQPDDRDQLGEELEQIVDGVESSLPWWSMAVADLAEHVLAGDDPWRLLRAREIAARGREAHPGSVGGRRCAAIVAELEMPDYSLSVMQTDGLERRSIEVRHKNLDALHLRAFRVDLQKRVRRGEGLDLLPGRREIESVLQGGRPVYEWEVNLESTPDLGFHRSFVTPGIDAPGTYLVIASATADFAEESNHLEAVFLNLSDLVLVVRRAAVGLEVTVRSGSTGRAVEGAVVELYSRDWRSERHRLLARTESGRDGRAAFPLPASDSTVFVMASFRGQVALDPRGRWLDHRHDREDPRRAALVYTDRSVYRPAQGIAWKVVAYQGEASSGRFETIPRQILTVELLDANLETVEQTVVETNEFGSVSGRFEIPPGRLLGAWTVRSSLGGEARVRVEEYKRPTFEVTLDLAKSALRLNRMARLKGGARYYFGFPVVDAEVRWSVTRLPVYPPWWSWWYGGSPDQESRTIASGRSEVDSEGRFEIDFLPAADERDADRGVTFRYRVTAEVTDAGGETRRAERVFRLGFVSVEAAFMDFPGFLAAGAPGVVEMMRTDLDGAPRGGEGRWRLVTLARPETTPLPADAPIRRPSEPDGQRPAFRTAGDDLRPRWEGAEPEEFLRLWGEGRELARGTVLHGDDGRASIRLPVLEAAAYRLMYETEDEDGALFESSRELVVADRHTSLELPILLRAESTAVSAGDIARFLVHSGLEDQELVFELFRGDEILDRRVHRPARDGSMIEVDVTSRHRGGISARLTGVRDHQLLSQTAAVFVPWDDRALSLSFSSFRDRLEPGTTERWSVVVKASDEEALALGSAEVLAYMFDRSLDLFEPHHPPAPLDLYPRWWAQRPVDVTLGATRSSWERGRLGEVPDMPTLRGDRLRFLEGYGIGGMGRRGMAGGLIEAVAMSAPPPAPGLELAEDQAEDPVQAVEDAGVETPAGQEGSLPDPLRSEFSETAFWKPHLRVGRNGSVAFEFTVPDSLTEWSVWVHALTRDLRSGRLEARAVSAKELMVRPYLPRFLRERDEVEVRVMVSNAGAMPLEGALDLELLDADSGLDVGADFGLDEIDTKGLAFLVGPGESATIPLRLTTPARVGAVELTARARAGDQEDGERRALPLLPGRFHLAQSRFAALAGADRRELRFPDLAADDDPTRINEQLVVTIDGQMLYGVLQALPFLASYPYECTEQTLNRFLSAAIVSTTFDSNPAIARMAREFSSRETRTQPWTLDDPNRRMALEETPWLDLARGGKEDASEIVNVLDPKIARSQRRSSLAKLEKAQTASGGFPWWPGGPPSPHMTLYLLSGLSRALEYGIDVPAPMVERAWSYLGRYYVDEMVGEMSDKDCCWELVTFLNYVLSAYPDDSWTGGVFSPDDRRRMLGFSFRHWKEHTPLLKGYLALTLHREGRPRDARLVFDSVMDSARSDPDLGIFWAPEERGWLWYNDTLESHAFALRALMELSPDDGRRHGLVQWLFLNRKLNQWKSTRATAEAVYALVHYLSQEGNLGGREAIDVRIGDRVPETMRFEPDEYSGRNRQIVLPGSGLEPARDANIVVEKTSPGLAFASATWHFSTEKLPETAVGDLFSVERRYFQRRLEGEEWVLVPLDENAALEPGDQVEVHLRIRAAHAAEYVHVRDPRPAGFEPEGLTSGYRWRLGIAWYEEIRDSGTNFFVEWLPAGEYTLEYRLRASLPGVFKAAPASLQSMYAPEFAAHSAGGMLTIDN